ncbi:hypothetical protein [Algicola sagamiensis]|uniref:hypothetical protein n=1 Tax=Algicola sagamiensis TaxID=163869 RepID=UPI000381831F|nr:hypothetical protein [Algicola sagamiensis]
MLSTDVNRTQENIEIPEEVCVDEVTTEVQVSSINGVQRAVQFLERPVLPVPQFSYQQPSQQKNKPIDQVVVQTIHYALKAELEKLFAYRTKSDNHDFSMKLETLCHQIKTSIDKFGHSLSGTKIYELDSVLEMIMESRQLLEQIEGKSKVDLSTYDDKQQILRELLFKENGQWGDAFHQSDRNQKSMIQRFNMDERIHTQQDTNAKKSEQLVSLSLCNMIADACGGFCNPHCQKGEISCRRVRHMQQEQERMEAKAEVRAEAMAKARAEEVRVEVMDEAWAKKVRIEEIRQKERDEEAKRVI